MLFRGFPFLTDLMNRRFETERITEIEKQNSAKVEEANRKCLIELKLAREKWKIERDQWQNQMKIKQETELTSKVSSRAVRDFHPPTTFPRTSRICSM